MEDIFEGDSKSGSQSFDVKHFLSKLIENYKWILLTLAVFLVGAFIYLRYATPQYKVSSYILVGGAELQNSTNSILTNAGLVNEIDNAAASVNNEIFILKSHKLNGDVIDSLNLDILISKLGRLKSEQLMIDSLSFGLQVRRKDLNKSSAIYSLDVNEQNYLIHDGRQEFKGEYGQSLVIHGDTLVLSKKPNQALEEREYSLQFAGRLSTIRKYVSRLTVEPAKEGGAGLLKLSVVDELPFRATSYINALIHFYNVSYLEYKNQAIRRALVFLGERLETVSAELDQQESQVRDFKAGNQIYDVSTRANELLTSLQTVDEQASRNRHQLELLTLIESSIKNYKEGEEIVASQSGIEDPVLSQQVAKYNELVFRKQGIQTTGTPNDPRLAPLNSQLNDLSSSILKNIDNIRKRIATEERFTASQERKYANRFQSLPDKEKRLVELTRRLAIKESQYTYLLQKREETEIQLVSSDGDRSRTVDDILTEGVVYPVKLMVYGIAFLAGILLPVLVVLLKVLLNQKIETRKEIENKVTVPIIGELNFSVTESPIVISANKRTAVAEQLRAIRTNLNFIGADTELKVFIVTSTVSGEGKSFVSLNLANSMAISDKKVAVLELDLRKPMLSKNLGIHNRVGISNFIVNDQITPEDIIQPLKEYPNLFLINSGPIPPNPGELIIHPRMAELITYLKSKFDYVILDTPPVGLVADSLVLSRLADVSLFVIRPNYSTRASFELINDLQESKKLPKMSLVVNGIDPQKGYGSYGYGYGYGYYSDDPQTYKNSLVRFIEFIKRRLLK